MGPTLFHLFFPITKFSKYSIPENSPLFKPVKQPTAFNVHRYLNEINYPGIKESLKDQMKSMDPNNFMQLAYKNYSDKIIK